MHKSYSACRQCTWLLCFISFHAWSACQTNVDAPPPESPYLGYTNTGYKGEPERDPIWHQEVRQAKNKDGSLSFQLRRRPSVHFDSIEPIDLGGGVMGFAALRQGCQQLLNRQGLPFSTPQFDAAEAEDLQSTVLGRGQALLRLKVDESYFWARFSRGHLLAVSQHPYLMSYSSTSLHLGHLPPYLRDVSVSFNNGHSVVDLRTLKELLPAEWSGVGGVNVNNDTQITRYIQAYRDTKRTLFPLEGGAPLLENITSLTVLNDWFPLQKGLPAINRAALLVQIEGEAGCRLLDFQLQPLMLQLLPFRHGECNVPHVLFDQKYLFTDTDGQNVHVYAIEPEGKLRWISSTVGQLEAAIGETGLMVISQQSEQKTVHHLYFADGKRVDEEDYSGFKNLGCGFMEVQLHNQWLTLFHDGRTSTDRFFPFSC